MPTISQKKRYVIAESKPAKIAFGVLLGSAVGAMVAHGLSEHKTVTHKHYLKYMILVSLAMTTIVLIDPKPVQFEV